MKCPECGTDGFLPESGCFSCGYLPPALRPTPTAPEEDLDMPIEELNRMLTQLGVAPLSDPEARTQSTETVPVPNSPAGETAAPEWRAPEAPAEEATAPDASVVETAAPDASASKKHAMELVALDDQDPGIEGSPLYLDVPHGSVGIPLAEGSERITSSKSHKGLPPERLRNARHVAGPLRALTNALGRISGWIGESPHVFRTGWRHLKSGVMSKFPPRRSVSSGKKVETGADLLPELFKAPLVPESVQVNANPSENIPSETPAKRHRARKPLPQAFFWVGVPILALLVTVGILAGVLQLRDRRLHPTDPPPNSPQSWTYVPWTPPPTPSLVPFIVVGE